jgi:transposase
VIDDETRAKIRRLHYAEHWTIGTIAAELGLHHDTVSRALGQRKVEALRVRATKLDIYKDFIRKTLEEYPRLCATRLHDMIVDRGYEGSAVAVRRYAKRVRPAGTKEAFLRLNTLPGEQGQVDWGTFGRVQIGNATRTLSCFVMALGYSRAFYGRFYYDQRLENFLSGHERSFKKLRGVPRELLYDNLKSVVMARSGDHVQFHDKLLELAGHYHFAPKPCAPYRPNEKGKVERTIQYLRHSFFAARQYRDLEDLNDQLERWIDEVAHRRRAPGDGAGRTVAALHELERERLLPLPEHPFDCELMRATKVGKSPYVRFDGNEYSVPPSQVGRTVTLVVSDTRVRVTHDAEVLADHPRCFDRGQVIEEPEHLAALHRQKRHAAHLRGRDRLRSHVPHADALLERVALYGSNLGGEVSRLLRLLDEHGVAETDAAIAIALERGANSAGSVAYILDQRARARGRLPAVPVVLPERVRELDVEPHDLGAYDELDVDISPEPSADHETQDEDKSNDDQD